MSIFSAIKNVIFGWRPSAEDVAAGQAQRQQEQQADAGGALGREIGSGTAQVGQPQPTTGAPASGGVDVEATLTQRMRDKGDPDLNWRTSIVDLMKLLDLDSSLENRRELADELGYDGERNGSAEMNMWLHREVMRQLAANGGRVPASMTD
jgi:hypothetical protein